MLCASEQEIALAEKVQRSVVKRRRDELSQQVGVFIVFSSRCRMEWEDCVCRPLREWSDSDILGCQMFYRGSEVTGCAGGDLSDPVVGGESATSSAKADRGYIVEGVTSCPFERILRDPSEGHVVVSCPFPYVSHRD